MRIEKELNFPIEWFILLIKRIDESLINFYDKVLSPSWLQLIQNSKYYIHNYEYTFFENEYLIYCNHSHWGYKDLKENLILQYPLLSFEKDEKYKDICQSAFTQKPNFPKI